MPRVLNQGYVSTVAEAERGVIPGSWYECRRQGRDRVHGSGEDYYPSAAYATLDAVKGAGQIVITDPGFGPDDGFSGYFPKGRVGRWGDHSAAVSDEAGNIWMATEAINPPLLALPPGALAATWGRFIAAIAP